MKILVTGGAGFIGSHVVDAYVAIGHEVLIVDNLSTGQRANLNPKAKFIECDIVDQKKIQKIILEEKPDAINHHAAHIQVGYSVKNPQFDAQNNIIGLLNIMEAAKKAGVKRVVMAATGGAMYGNKKTPFTEQMKEQPLSPYGISKRAGELYLNYYHEIHQIHYVSLRYSNVYGPRQNSHGESGVIAIFLEALGEGKPAIINGNGKHTRDYIYVSDVVMANVLALETYFVGELNIGTGIETSTNEVFDKLVSELGIDMPREYGPERIGEQVTSSLDASKAREILDWHVRINFDEGVKRTVAWFKNKA
ncbi:MAG: NAD-dependent epimerase/dehydratase family protein [Candidatus Pacebacteria bacterium]|nr:NAD-dependent epimerase/dehydratase family protein [Candidatus Paceibacterota bacterium]